tara:strand:- start:122 stop:388 length:267 start_codon:yes stop_codon:yes gene_type:complete
MTLRERRDQWEKGGEPVLTVAHGETNPEVFVIVEFPDRLGDHRNYDLHRYFKIGDNWEVSCDEKRIMLPLALTIVTSWFNDLYPKEQD